MHTLYLNKLVKGGKLVRQKILKLKGLPSILVIFGGALIALGPEVIRLLGLGFVVVAFALPLIQWLGEGG